MLGCERRLVSASILSRSCFASFPVYVYKFSSNYLNNIIFIYNSLGPLAKDSPCIILYYIVSYRIVLYHIVSYHIMSYVMSYVLSYILYIISYILYHVMSSCHIKYISYYISYHISYNMSYIILFNFDCALTTLF